MKYYILVLFIFLISCGRKGPCNVERISKTVFDSINVKGDFILENQKHQIDTLKIKSYNDEFETFRNIGLMVHQECGHFIYCTYDFKGETINLSLKKNEDEMIFKVESLHMKNEYECDKNANFHEALIMDGQYCEESIFDKVAFENFKIKYILTKNGDKWLPKKIIPNKLMNE